MHYENYTVEDFLLDASFQKYCLGSGDEEIQFWNDWINSHPEKKQEVEKAKELYFILNGNITSDQFTIHEKKFRDAVFNLADSTEEVNRQAASGKAIVRSLFSKKIIRISAAAACIIIVAGVAFFVQKFNGKNSTTSSQSIIASGPAEHKVLLLPDGTKVVLNGKSSIKTDLGFNGSSRELTLIGEALFDVKHDPSRPFIIHTQYMDVRVLGTVFNVKAYPDKKFAETSLLNGSVELTLKKAHDNKIILKPNERISVSYVVEKNTESEPVVTKTNLNISEQLAKSMAGRDIDSGMAEIIWNKSNLVFENSTFENIAMQLQQRFGVKIHFNDEAVKYYKFTGDFSDDSISQVLNALYLSRRFNYEIRGNEIIISK